MSEFNSSEAEALRTIWREFATEEWPLLYAALRARMGYKGGTVAVTFDGDALTAHRTWPTPSETFDLERHDVDLQRRIRDAVDRAETLLRVLDTRSDA